MSHRVIACALLLLGSFLNLAGAAASQYDAILEFQFINAEGELVPGACLFGVPIAFTFTVCDNRSASELAARNAVSDEEATGGIIRVTGHYSGSDASLSYTVSFVPSGYRVVMPSSGEFTVHPASEQLRTYTVTLAPSSGSGQVSAGSSDGVCSPGADCQGNSTSSRGSTGCTVVELYPGYPGYRGVLPGLVGKGDTACLDDLERMDPGFSRMREDDANRETARSLGIAGDIRDWTWEIWMAIGAERGYGYICYACIWLSDQLIEPIGPFADAFGSDPRRQLMYPWSNAFALDFGLSHEISQYRLDRITDGELRIFASVMYQGYPTATELATAATSILGSFFDIPGYQSGYRDYGFAERQIICRGGHVPVSLSANPADRSWLTYFGLLVVASGSLAPAPDVFVSARLSILDREFTDWRAQTYTATFTGDFPQYLEISRGIEC